MHHIVKHSSTNPYLWKTSIYSGQCDILTHVHHQTFIIHVHICNLLRLTNNKYYLNLPDELTPVSPQSTLTVCSNSLAIHTINPSSTIYGLNTELLIRYCIKLTMGSRCFICLAWGSDRCFLPDTVSNNCRKSSAIKTKRKRNLFWYRFYFVLFTWHAIHSVFYNSFQLLKGCGAHSCINCPLLLHVSISCTYNYH